METLAENRKATFDYFIEDKLEAGVVLTGSEIKSIKAGNVNLKDSYAIIKNDECFLLNVHVSPYKDTTMSIDKVDPVRTRKLLLHKSEIVKLERKVKVKGYTLIPLDIHLVKGRAKVTIGLARGKQLFNKKESIREKDIKRETQRELKNSR